MKKVLKISILMLMTSSLPVAMLMAAKVGYLNKPFCMMSDVEFFLGAIVITVLSISSMFGLICIMPMTLNTMFSTIEYLTKE